MSALSLVSTIIPSRTKHETNNIGFKIPASVNQNTKNGLSPPQMVGKASATARNTTHISIFFSLETHFMFLCIK
ncbi:hypothetical protein Hanom_Chr10g00885701 [Helianthus anomalus]